MADIPVYRAQKGDFRWDGVDLHAYKDEGSAPFKDITRQTLFKRPDMAGELRYFEVAPGGHSTLERHQHVHAVMILRGRGRCLVGADIRTIEPLDLISIDPMQWHQFRAAPDEPLGFLCMVDIERDKPQLPTEDDLAELASNPEIAAFLASHSH
ncbi:MAG: cupin domain-containing protein [Hyphomicrobiales bacterium]|nr:cupin domain-containing protein [Hyphomicrobiales bacterium]